MLTIGSLFSGIGGLELGLEMAGLGPTLWQVEKEPFCRAVLAKHWPDAERFDDVCAVGTGLAPVDLICGGFPCQDVSSAGKGAGLAGERSGLWREYARVVRELRPAWVVVENVASGAAKWLDAVVGELDALGYACLPCPVSARDVGAPHRRERLFVVAHLVDESGAVQHAAGREVSGAAAHVAGFAPGSFARSPWPEARVDVADADGVALRQQLGRGEFGPGASVARDLGALGNAANAHDPRREGPGPGEQVTRRQGSSAHPGWAPQPDLVPLVHGLRGGLAGRRRRARIRALGNTVVPQCAEVVGWVIRELAAGQAHPRNDWRWDEPARAGREGAK